MEAENLITVLRREEKILSELKRISNKKQIALVANNRENLDVCIKDEERILPLIQKIEDERLYAIDEFYAENERIRKDYHIETLIEIFTRLLPDEIVAEIKRIHSEMKIDRKSVV